MSDPQTQGVVTLKAPLTGIMMPIEYVPDPVFAKKMVGDGFSIDPLVGELRAPVAGEVVDLQPSHHAVTLRSPEGLEILMHIGLDTVRMQGEGFTPQVKEGQQVNVGDLLISFDLDVVAAKAKSLLTQVVVTNTEAVAEIKPATGAVTAGKDDAATVTLAALDEAAASGNAAGHSASSQALLIANPTGLHARPTANLVNLAKTFSSDVRLRRGDDSANAKSIVSIMGLAVARGEKVVVTANGADADEAVKQLSEAIKAGLGEECPPLSAEELAAAENAGEKPAGGRHAARGTTPAAPAEPAKPRSGDPNLLLGVSASPGLAVGTVTQLRRNDIQVEENASDHHLERRKLNTAIDRALLDLSALQKNLSEEGHGDKAAIFAAHQEILGDPELLDRAASMIDKGKSAPFAWRSAFNSFADQLESLDNEVLAGRAADMRDVGQRVLEELTGQRSEALELPEGTILIAEELTPSDTAQLDRSKVVGFATVNGGASSHVAIIARSLDLPAVAGIESMALSIADGTQVVLDGTKGTLQQNLSEEQIQQIKDRQERQAALKAEADAHKFEPAATKDGHTVKVVANIGGPEDAAQANPMGAEGVGLLRSEFVFMKRNTAPSEAEQAEVYTACAKALEPGQPLVIRTLDVGGDKPLSYVPIPAEENPFLGVRGVRVGLEQPEILRTQIRAILASAEAGAELHIMFPMIATIDDWRQAKKIYDEERAKVEINAKVSVGIMMEVPSVGVMAEQFANEKGCDFFSVGTNDLTSYTLAMDRGHPKLASQVDPCNPAVLNLIGNAAKALHRHGKWLGVCGSVASDPQAVPLLVGLGVDELSCSIPAIPAVKAAVRSYSLDECKELAAVAITKATPAQVRALIPTDNA